MQIPGIKERLSEIGETVSLYTGAGGMDIGFYLAGFNTIWANDIDKYAIQSYKELFPGHPAVVGDLLDQKLPKKRNIELVIGGPPCQGFSVAGNMDPKDPRSKHVWNFLSVVRKLTPKVFVMENVKSLAMNSRWQNLMAGLRNEAKTMGYETRLLILNASHFGVPQARERMFLVGFKEGKFVDPVPVSVKRPPIVRTTLKDLPSYGELGNNTLCTAIITPAKNPVLRKSPFAGMLFNGQGRPLNLQMPALTLPASMGGNRTPIIDQSCLKNTTTVSWIVEYHKHLMKGGKPFAKVPDILRRLTVEEAGAIQTFPKGMKFFGTHTTKFRQIGNAVPPLLSYHVALAIRKSLFLG